MTQASEQIAKQFTNATVIKRIWGDVLANVRVYGAKGDGKTDDTSAIQLAIDTVNSSGGVVYFPKGTYILNTALTMKSNVTLEGNNAILKGVYTTPITLINGNGISNARIKNMIIRNGAAEAVADIGVLRTVRFIDCHDIIVEDCEISYGYDWQLSFEQSYDCHVRNHKSYGMGNGFPGGRDGIHFLDCDDCTVDTAYIESGDDCVAITTQTKTSKNIQVRNIRGKSQIGSMVIFNEEGATTFPISNCKVNNVEAVAAVRDLVRVESINGTLHTDFEVTSIRGTATNHGLYFKGTNKVAVNGKCDVVSTTQHGIYVNNCDFVTVGEGITATANAAAFCGLQVDVSANVVVIGAMFRDSGLYGVQLLNSSDVYLNNVRSLENGGLSFASNTGGNLRISGCTRVRINGGIYYGAVGTSFNGISFAGATGGTDVVERNAIAGGTNPRGHANFDPKFGIATIASGATTIAVTHGLGATPNEVIVTPKGNIGAVWVTSIGATQFTINCATAPGSNTDVSWTAARTQ